ncbi:MAG: hypothetical protein J0I20_34040 [Chloroflexi bacterium]|nr:hypothetical protein [Chloroflexota bacterium]OJW05583.1 MAG: hypothetical protein BGO39_02920 [Chloroflexi bacterium 54-19]
MPNVWLIAKNKRLPSARRPTVYCPVYDYIDLIRADGGACAESEVLGGYFLVKVRASVSTLQTIAADPLIIYVPLSKLDDPVSSLTANQRTVLRNVLLSMGYSTAELLAALPNIAQATLGQVLRFANNRRQDTTYDEATDTVNYNGPVQACVPVDLIDALVQ